MTALPITVPHPAIDDFCQRNHIQKLSLFGSVLTPRFGDGSDVDVLVEFEPGRTPGLFGAARMERELSALFGRKVDLRTPYDLSLGFRNQVIASALTQYESR